ncbi:MAG: PilW family protein [Aquabacterium sp.]|nr:PilW family protein [Aquabacterium sp.]
MRSPSRPAQNGFTLIELMVSMVLGLLTVLVITQVTVQAEGRKRTVSMGNDAQVNGSLSLFTLQKDIQMAGYGATASPDALGCQVNRKYDTGGATSQFTLAPVMISNGANGAPDTITVLQASTHNISVPILVKADHAQTGTYFVVDGAMGVSTGDLMIAAPKTQTASTQCTLLSVTSNSASADTTLSSTRIPHTTTSKWNQSSIFPTGGYLLNDSYLLNMGQLILRTYAINSSNNLTSTDVSPVDGSAATQELYPQIVNLQAFYGKDTNADGVIDTYDNTNPTTAAGWQQVLTIRLAIVARSGQFERDVVTPTMPAWDVGAQVTVSGTTTSTCNGSSKCVELKVDSLTDWQHYRYKVYETVVPLRNVLWNS